MTDLELRIPPLLVVVVFGMLMSVSATFLQALDFAIPYRFWLAAGLIGMAVIVVLVAGFLFHRAETTVDPRYPGNSNALVISGVYRFSRNPMYVGFALALLGWAVMLGNWVAVSAVPVFVWYINRFQIAPEERVMQEKFGEAYVAYCARVRRWV